VGWEMAWVAGRAGQRFVWFAVLDRRPLGYVSCMDEIDLTAPALVCTLSPSPAESSTLLLAYQVLDELAQHGFGAAGRCFASSITTSNRASNSIWGRGNAWLAIREQIMTADILLISTPTWMSQHSSVCGRVLERLDAELSETDDEGRLQTYGNVGAPPVVGNEDGADAISAALFQTLNDVGCTIPAGARHVLER
jgi:multimeric flavodoxin WrbA